MMTTEETAMATLLLLFPGVFLLLEAGSSLMTADNNNNAGNGRGNLLLHNGLSFGLFPGVFFVFTGWQQLDDCR